MPPNATFYENNARNEFLLILGNQIPHKHFTLSIRATEHLTPVPLGGIIQRFLLHKQMVFLPADPSFQDGRPSMGKPEIKKKVKRPPKTFPNLPIFITQGRHYRGLFFQIEVF